MAATAASRLQIGQIFLSLFRLAPNSIVQKAHYSHWRVKGRESKKGNVIVVCRIKIYDGRFTWNVERCNGCSERNILIGFDELNVAFIFGNSSLSCCERKAEKICH